VKNRDIKKYKIVLYLSFKGGKNRYIQKSKSVLYFW